MRLLKRTCIFVVLALVSAAVPAQAIPKDLNDVLNKEVRRVSADDTLEEAGSNTRFCRLHQKVSVAACEVALNYKGGNGSETFLLVLQQEKSSGNWRVLHREHFDDRTKAPWSRKSSIVGNKEIKIPLTICHPDRRETCRYPDKPIVIGLIDK
jgi:hypothetical protein